MISVQNILDMPLMENAKVVAGLSGLDKEVSHVTVMEVPDIKKWLKGNDLLITCFYSVRDSVEAQRRLIEDLADTCACIVIKTGQYIGPIADSVKDAADRCGLPLITIPYQLTYIDILVGVMIRLMEDSGSEEVRQKFLKDILYENYCGTSLMIERGRLLGLDIERHYFAAMLLGRRKGSKGTGARFDCWAHDLIKSIRRHSSVHACYRVCVENGALILVEAADRAALSRVLSSYASDDNVLSATGLDPEAAGLGFGGIGQGLAGIRASYIAACKTFQAGSCLYPRRCAYPFDKMNHLCICQELFAKDNEYALSSVLLQLHSRELVDTLFTYFECEGNINETAERLFVHRNTIRYRLSCIQEKTGLSLRSPGDMFQLYLAVLALKFQRSRMPLPETRPQKD